MKGVAFRYLAIKAFKAREPLDGIKADVNRSIDLLTQAGAKVELSHAQILMARIAISEKRYQMQKNCSRLPGMYFQK